MPEISLYKKNRDKENSGLKNFLSVDCSWQHLIFVNNPERPTNTPPQRRCICCEACHRCALQMMTHPWEGPHPRAAQVFILPKLQSETLIIFSHVLLFKNPLSIYRIKSFNRIKFLACSILLTIKS